MEIKLKEGKITLKELAKWFDCSYDTMKKTKDKKLQTLRAFADYHLEPCGKTGKKSNIIIDKVYCSTYSRTYEDVKKLKSKYWNKSGTGVDTAARVGDEMWRKENVINMRIRQSTCKRYTGAAEREEYGSVLKPDVGGTKGYRKSVYCQRIFNDETKEYYYRPLTCDELNVLMSAIIDAKIETGLDEMEMYDELYNHADEYSEDELKNCVYETFKRKVPRAKYENFIGIATQKLGFRPIKATKEIPYEEESAW